MSEPTPQPTPAQTSDLEERAQVLPPATAVEPVEKLDQAAEPVEKLDQAAEPVEAPVETPDVVQVAAPDASSLSPEPLIAQPTKESDVAAAAVRESASSAGAPAPVSSVSRVSRTQPGAPVPSPALLARQAPGPALSPAQLAGRLHPVVPGVRSSQFGRVAEDGTVFVKTPDGEKEVGSYPGATPEEALAYFTRKYTEVDAQVDLLLQRVTRTELSPKEAADGLAQLRETTKDMRAVGDLVALATKIEDIATALETRRQVEAAERAQAREAAKARRLAIVAAAETIAAQPEEKIQWKASSAQMRQLLEDWKVAQKDGPRLDRETEQALWHRLSSARNGFDKLRRVHFAQLGNAQSAAKAAKEELVEEAERLAQSTEWGATAGAFKRLMDRWRQTGRAARGDDDALWSRFKAAQDRFFAAKDHVVAAENEEYAHNLRVKEDLLTRAQALLPPHDLETAKAQLRQIQDAWDAVGKVPRADMDRIEKGIRRVEAAVREAEDRKWRRTNPEVAARAQSLVTQLEAACEGLRTDLAKAQASGNAKDIAKAREALGAREAWLAQARSGLAEFSP